jgi:hypothetical protein
LRLLEEELRLEEEESRLQIRELEISGRKNNKPVEDLLSRFSRYVTVDTSSALSSAYPLFAGRVESVTENDLNLYNLRRAVKLQLRQ